MDNILPENEFVEVEGRQYINPQTGLDESTQFIENLRATQGQQNQQIASDTYNLGTDIPSVQGGLGTNTVSDMGYFTSRYQVPQTNSAVANLRAVAQAQALNDVLSNEQAIWKNRYQQAYRNYQKRQYNRSYGGGGGGYGDPETTAGKGDVDQKSTDDDTVVTYDGSAHVVPGQQMVIGPDGIAAGYINGQYVEIKPGQTYKPPLNLTPTNSIGEASPLAPVNSLQRR